MEDLIAKKPLGKTDQEELAIRKMLDLAARSNRDPYWYGTNQEYQQFQRDSFERKNKKR